MIKRTLTAVAVVAMVAVITQSASAAITVDGFVTHQSTTTGTAFSFDASGSDKLVVIATAEHGFNNTNGDVTGIVYDPDGAGALDPIALTLAVERSPVTGNITHNAIWYLDNPGGDGNGTILVSAVNREAVTAMGLSGTLAGVGAVAISPDNSKSVDITTTAAGSAVITSHGMGGDGNTANVLNVDTVAPLVEAGAIEFGSNWGGHVSGYVEDAGAAGAKTYSYTGGSATGVHTIAAEFLMVPEPASIALLGMGGLLIARRRRTA